MDIAQEALDSAKSAHKRIDTVQEEVKDIRQLTAAMARVDVKEIKNDVKAITNRPGKLWDILVGAAIGAIVTGFVAAILKLIFK